MKQEITRFIREEDGQGIPEYALILGATIAVSIAIVRIFEPEIVELYRTVRGWLVQGTENIESANPTSSGS